MQHTNESQFLPLKPTSATGYKGIYHQMAPLCEETMWRKNRNGKFMIYYKMNPITHQVHSSLPQGLT